jgi:hypothetical protein
MRTHGGAYEPHYHRQSDCRVIYDDDDEADNEDCHRDVLRHYLPDEGRTWHRHRRSDCSVQVYEEEDGPTTGVDGCIQIGPAVICP